MLHRKCDGVIRSLELRGDKWEVRAVKAEARVAELEAAITEELCRDPTCARCARFRDVLKGKSLD